MSAFFIRIKRFVCVLSVAFTVVVLFYAAALHNAETVDVGKNFYFLVSASEHIEASTHLTQWSGGAGYPLSYSGGEYAAYAVYFTESEGKKAQTAVKKTGEKTEVLVLQGNPICFKSRAEKENSTRIVGAFNCLYGCMQVLNGEIVRLEQGATQESSKRILQTLSRQFSYLQTEHQNTINGYSSVCEKAKTRLSEVTSDIVYAKDLRYLLCELSVAYVNLSKNFTL